MITLGALAALALLPASAGAAKVESFELPTPLVDTSTPGGKLSGGRTVPKVNVLLPDGYRKNSKRRWPVLWLLHGANGGANTWLGRHNNIERLAAGLPAIVVMPDGGMFGMYTDWLNGGKRGDPAWATFHLQQVREEIERRYPIRKKRRWHAIGGISMGGQGTLRYAALLPGYFGTAVALSAATPDIQSPVTQLGVAILPLASGTAVNYRAIWGPANGPYAEGNSPMALAPNFEHSRVYLSSGNGVNCPGDPPTGTYAVDIITEAGLHSIQAPFAAKIRAEGAEVTDVSTCGVHTFGVWDRAFPAAREWGFFRKVPANPRSWTYRTIAQTGEMWGLRFHFARPPGQVAEFARRGRVLSGTGTGTVRIRGPKRCNFTTSLPFGRRVARACWR